MPCSWPSFTSDLWGIFQQHPKCFRLDLWGFLTFSWRKLGRSSTHLPETSCGKICGLLGCYAASVGNSLPKFLDKLLVRYSCTKKEDGTNRRCVISQKSADLIYFAAKTQNQVDEFIIFCVGRKKFKYGVFNWDACVTHHMVSFLNLLYILESNLHPNLIRTSFCRFLKRKKS